MNLNATMLIGKRQLPFIFSIGLLIVLSILYFAFTERHLIEEHLIPGIITTAVTFLLFLFTLVNFMITSFIDPGFYPINTDNDEYEVFVHGFNKPTVVRGGYTHSMRWCDDCKHYRPPRSHHCTICEMCVEQFDHHCPWVDNCVGVKNYRYFFLFVTSLLVYIIVGWCLTVVAIVLKRNELLQVIPEFILSVLLIIVFIPVIILWGFHIYLVAIGKTTFEHIKSEGPSPYDRGFFCNLFLLFFTPSHPKYHKYTYSKETKRIIDDLNRDRSAETFTQLDTQHIKSKADITLHLPSCQMNINSSDYTANMNSIPNFQQYYLPRDDSKINMYNPHLDTIVLNDSNQHLHIPLNTTFSVPKSVISTDI